LAAGNAEADVLGGDLFDLVASSKDDEIIFEQKLRFQFVIDAADVHEEQSVIQDEDIGGKNALAGALEKAGAPALAKSTGAASLGEQSPRSEQTGPRPWDRARSRNRRGCRRSFCLDHSWMRSAPGFRAR